MWSVCFGICLGVLYAQVMEWVIHRYVLHGIGRKRGHPLSFHFHQHHRSARLNHFRDDVYHQHPFQWNSSGKELLALLGLGLLHLPLVFVVPGFTVGGLFGLLRYYMLHRKSHLDPDWCKTHLPWHYDHHMAPNQHANWGVTTDWVDRLMGTRVFYLGSERANRDEQRRCVRHSGSLSDVGASL
ncbi:MAG: sterol desaturase family protein [Myxococcota bacterium]